MEKIKELCTKEEILQAFPVMRQLRNHLNEACYLELVLKAQEKENYKMFALFDNERIVAVIGFQPMITLYYGEYIWVCDLVTEGENRSKGYGQQLLSFVHEWGKVHGYKNVALSSGLARTDAHRFYEEKMDYARVSYVFKKSLE